MGVRPQAVFAVGMYPPPTHGMSLVNRIMSERLAAAGARVRVFDLAARADVPRPGLWARLRKAAIVARRLPAFMAACVADRPRAVYIGVSGGPGKLFELPFVALARLLALPVFFHHHCFAYLDRPTPLARALFACGGPGAVHVVLCGRMAALLEGAFGIGGSRVRVLSNAAVLDVSGGPRGEARDRAVTVGYLGNISREKGIGEYLSVMEALARVAPDVRGLVAGPFADAPAEALFRARAEGLGGAVTHLGPVFGAEKDRFFDQVDVLLFPSSYVNEADPLTIHEALAHGVPVIAWERGCIAEAVGADGGVVVPRGTDFVAAAVDCLVRWRTQAGAYGAAAKGARARYEALEAAYRTQAGQVVAEIADPAGEARRPAC